MSIYRCAVCDEQRDVDYDGCETLSTGELCCPVHKFTEDEVRSELEYWVFRKYLCREWHTYHDRHGELEHERLTRLIQGMLYGMSPDDECYGELDFLGDVAFELHPSIWDTEYIDA